MADVRELMKLTAAAQFEAAQVERATIAVERVEGKVAKLKAAVNAAEDGLEEHRAELAHYKSLASAAAEKAKVAEAEVLGQGGWAPTVAYVNAEPAEIKAED